MSSEATKSVSPYRLGIEAHYSSIWTPPFARERLAAGPIHDLPNDFAVLVMRRAKGLAVHATVGMSQPEDQERLELHMLSRSDRAVGSIVEILTAVAHFHRTGARLGHGHTVDFGSPWMRNSNCTLGLISLPYLDGPKLEWMESPRVRFLWLIPITRAERDFKKAHGLEALEQRFETASLDYLDPLRSSVV